MKRATKEEMGGWEERCCWPKGTRRRGGGGGRLIRSNTHTHACYRRDAGSKGAQGCTDHRRHTAARIFPRCHRGFRLLWRFTDYRKIVRHGCPVFSAVFNAALFFFFRCGSRDRNLRCAKTRWKKKIFKQSSTKEAACVKKAKPGLDYRISPAV